MKYIYQTAEGPVPVEISEEWASVLRELDEKEEAVRRRETRRHISFDDIDYEGPLFGREDPDIVRLSDLGSAVRDAVDRLPPVQSETIRMLFLEGCTGKELAARRGCCEEVVSRSKQKALKNLKKFLPEGGQF